MKFSRTTLRRLKDSLQEDIGSGDITTRLLIPKSAISTAKLEAKESGIFSGEPVARELCKAVDPSLRLRGLVKDGRPFHKGQTLLKISGKTQSILKVERTLINLLAKLSGIATLTHRFVKETRGTKAKILDTRKTTPLWRELEKYAVRSGGGENHRFGLYDEILVKDNHWKAMRKGGVSRALALTLQNKKFRVTFEVKDLSQLADVLSANFTPDCVLLDNFPLQELKRAVLFSRAFYQVLGSRYKIHRRRPLLEASGGIHLRNVRAVAKTGVDRISVGAITHSAPSLDFSLEIHDEK
ncbi:MAG: carboxylating nicotinate-nucleotide diphosphorylase [Candidatus Omnitrophica bacterium]|nr:carboxylating nicotinate-nucleotide diphosphorylase [Candidatus Omnitrophota bacterium]